MSDRLGENLSGTTDASCSVMLRRIAEWAQNRGYLLAACGRGLAGLWGDGDVRVDFLPYGSSSGLVLQVRSHAPRSYASDQSDLLMDYANMWNARCDWPKAYVRSVDGELRMFADALLDCSYDIDDDGLNRFLDSSLLSLLSFHDFLTAAG